MPLYPSSGDFSSVIALYFHGATYG
jgi:hypothetical protein